MKTKVLALLHRYLMRGVFYLLVLLLLASSLPPAALAAPIRVQPALQALVAQQPAAKVRVIIQKTDANATIEAMIAKLGGTVIDQLSIIHAVTAELPARAVLVLGQTPGVRWVALDSPMKSTLCLSCIDISRLASAYIRTIGADKVWNRAPYLQGQGIGVAIVDSGIQPQEDLYTIWGQNRLVAAVRFNTDYNQTPYDNYGHGNHVAGIVGGNGRRSLGAYIGVAPMVNLINVKVSNDDGGSSVANVIRGLQWIFNNADRYNIRVVNISLNDSVAESYHTSVLDAAVEALWFNGIVVVVSAGNGGNGRLYAPASDPFVITVGATDDKGTANLNDDTMTNFSAYGNTLDGFAKPDLVAPGRNIVSLMANPTSWLAVRHLTNILIGIGNFAYFRMSGTSMSAPMVAAAAALVIQGNPDLTPDQVKYRLKATARAFDTPARAGAGYLNLDAATTSATTQRANQNIEVSRLLAGTTQPLIWNTAIELSGGWQARGNSFWGKSNNNSDLQNSTTWGSDYWENAFGRAETSADATAGGAPEAATDVTATTDVTPELAPALEATTAITPELASAPAATPDVTPELAPAPAAVTAPEGTTVVEQPYRIFLPAIHQDQ